MLPYLAEPHLTIGHITIALFSVFVVIGILLMKYQINKQAIYHQLNAVIANDIFLLGLCIGFPLSHVFSVLWGSPSLVLTDPLILFQLNKGIDSFGGFLGFTLALLVYRWKYNLQGQLIPYCDCAAYSLCFGWIFCRLACAFAHDHPGRPSTGFLSIDYPPGIYGGIPRHNLGLDEALGTAVIFIVLFFLNRKKQKPGIIFTTLIILYSMFRFFLDFYRATDLPNADLRYGYFTPAQWGCIVVLMIGLYVARRENPALSSAVPAA